MIVLAALIFLPRWLMFALSAAMVLGHHAFDHVTPGSLGPLSGLWKVLHVPETLTWGEGRVLSIRYPLIPWPGVMALGYLFAPLLALPPERLRRTCLALGAALTLAFVGVRALNIYGDPHPWERLSTPLLTLFSFLNTTKYPPSAAYLLMTLGPAIGILPLIERVPALIRTPLAIFGRTPMFFYIVHLYVLQLGAIMYAVTRYGPGVVDLDRWPPDGYYIGLAPVFIAWGGALVVLFFLCRWYGGIKHQRPASWRWML
jgi:uncharacterized membrane protein